MDQKVVTYPNQNNQVVVGDNKQFATTEEQEDFFKNSPIDCQEKRVLEKGVLEKGFRTYYDDTRINTFITFERVFGTEAVMAFCEINAYKYRLRCGIKTQDPTEDITKAIYYENAAKFYFNRLDTKDEIVCPKRIKQPNPIK